MRGDVNGMVWKGEGVLGKVRKMGRRGKVEIGGEEVEVKKGEGEMRYLGVDEERWKLYGDGEDMKECRVGKVEGREGEWMMYEGF